MKYLFIAAVTLFFYSCSEGEHSTESHDHGHDHGTEAHSHDEAATTEINTSGKWIANVETYDAFNNMNQVIKGFWESSEDTRNYAYLSEELSYQTDYMIKNCSMKGEDHDELHKILHPVLTEIETIKNAPSYEEADASIKKIEELIATFFEKFDVENVPV